MSVDRDVQKIIEQQKKLDDLKGALAYCARVIFVTYPVKAASLLFATEVLGAGDAVGLGNIGFFKAYGLVWAFSVLTSWSMDEPPRPVRVVRDKWRGDRD